MTIGFDGSRAFAPERTGTENYSYQLLKALSKRDRKNKYIVYLRTPFFGKFPNNFLFKEICWSRLWTQGGMALQTFRDRLDVLFVPAHTLPLFRKPNLKTVVTVHDLGSQYLPSMHQVKQRLYLGFMQKFQLKTAAKIIAVSEATKTDLTQKIGIDKNKIDVVYEGFDREKFKFKNPKSKNYFLFVGTVQPRKNLERLILAFDKFISRNNSDIGQDLRLKNHKAYIIYHKSIKLIIAGQKGWLSDAIYALPKKLGIEDRVKFLGYIPDEKLPALYSGAVALVFPSLFEGFGLPILEAQACGCPVITSNISSMPEVAGKGAVYVNPYSVQSIRDGMIKIMNNDLRLKIKDLGFKNIKRFSWEKCARETLKVLENSI